MEAGGAAHRGDTPGGAPKARPPAKPTGLPLEAGQLLPFVGFVAVPSQQVLAAGISHNPGLTSLFSPSFFFPFSILLQEKALPKPPKQRAAAPCSSGVAQRCRIGPWGEGEQAGQDKGLTLFIVRINVGVFNAGSLTPSPRRASLARRGQAAFSSPAAPKRG